MSMPERLVTAGIAGVILLLSAGGAGAVVLVGTGDPALDVPAVQAAVDQGGTVTLRGTFDFGTHAGNHIIVPGRAGIAQDVRGQSTVFIYQQDVTILGETDANGNLLTVIRNGMPPFWIGWDGNVAREQPPGTPNVDYGIERLPQDIDGRVCYRDTGCASGYLGDQTRYAIPFTTVSATVRQVCFDSPLHYGVKATAGRNIAYVGNVMRNVQWGGLIHMNNFCDATQVSCGFGALEIFYAPFISHSLTGTLTMRGNRVEGSGTEIINTHAGECFGLVGLGTHAVVSIAENEVSNVGRTPDGQGPNAQAVSIGVIDNYAAVPSVDGNVIRNSADMGIWTLTALASAPAALVIDNKIGDCPIGIKAETWGPQSGCDIQGNFISNCALGLATGTHVASVTRNVIWDCGRGASLGGTGAFTAENNTIVGNSGNGIQLYSPGTVTSIAGNIVVDNLEGIRLPAGTDPNRVRCNDVWNNGANWLGIPDPSGTQGNFAMDPLFCNGEYHDYWLTPASPCLPGNHPQGADCDTIGAIGGCSESAVLDGESMDREDPVVSLLGPWPNPSPIAMRFGILLAHPSRVQVGLFSVTGRAVAQLVDGEFPKGYHSISRSIPDLKMPDLPGGVYYLRVNAAGRVQTRTIVLVR